MAETGYFIRSRGKISGPFDVTSLQKLIKRGMLSRMDEVSSDRLSWTGASQFEELFPAPAAVAESYSPAPVSAPAAAGSVPAVMHEGGMYYYVQAGATVGPVPAGVLRALAQNGTLRPDDLVWGEGAQSATPAGQLPVLIPIYSGPLIYANSSQSARPLSDAERVRCQNILDSVQTIALVCGVVIGCLLLLFLNLPVGTNADGKSLFWWEILKQPRTGSAAILLFFILFAGLIVGAIGAAMRGLVRAWFFVAVSGLSFLLFLVVGLSSAETDGGYFFVLVIPYLAAALIGICYFRDCALCVSAGAIFQAIFGGALLLFSLIVLVVALVQRSPLPARTFLHSDQLPGTVLFAETMGGLSWIAAVTAGVLALVMLKSIFSRAINWTCCISAGLSLILSMSAVLILCCWFINDQDYDRKGLIIFVCFRVLAIFVALVAVMAVGMMELFTTWHFKQLLRGGKV